MFRVAGRYGRVDNGAMAGRAKLIGFNHVALEVGDIEEALEFYGRLFEIELRGRGPRMAFIDAGDQFIALAEGENRSPDEHRHIGMVVDDRRVVRRALKEMGVEIMPGMGHERLQKSEKALEELRRKGLAPE